MAARQTRSKIIDAAIRIVRENAPTKLTLDEAARQAGVSKGGVLYHFTSKDELIRAMIEKLVRDQDSHINELYEREPEGPYRWLRAYVNMFFKPDGPGNDPASAALLAAMALNPGLLDPIRAMLRAANTRMVSDSPNKDLADMIALALDGLFLNQAIGMRRYDDDTLGKLREAALSTLS